MTDHEIRQLLQELREEPVPRDSLARVRTRIAQRTEPRRRVGFAWLTAGIAAAALLAAIVPRVAPQESAPLPAIVARYPEAPSASPTVQRVKHRSVRKPPLAAAPVQIRIQTNDPDVVIVLTGE